MIHGKHVWICAILAVACCLFGCRSRDVEVASQSAYYWRTEWRIDSTERAFMQEWRIRRVYCRYFDVVMDDKAGEPMPNATIAFNEAVPTDVEIVPTVFITEDCMHIEWPGLAERIVKRIAQMNETHDIPDVSEIQIDCDYTSRSRLWFYAFLEQVRTEARSRGMGLSVTIRLHQLAMSPPPADYGVLMLYNTGDPMKWAERNPVLDLRDVEPYLPRLADYYLPLAAAYPIYQWTRHIHGVRIEHTVDADELLRVKAAVERRRPGLARSIIVYHLDKDNIKRYDTDTFKALFEH